MMELTINPRTVLTKYGFIKKSIELEKKSFPVSFKNPFLNHDRTFMI